MRYLSVIRQKSLTERNETDTCPLTDSKRVHVIDLKISLLSDFSQINAVSQNFNLLPCLYFSFVNVIRLNKQEVRFLF